ncbi:fimbria/pilus outer membrane usher protein [Enterobacter asburiae]|uniref:fimbria/pilus outer membrane usher protein n=1 Tax=Enterobacter asburiae TaxID=61645 RepID=UPI002003C15C|nr:fimbria/pilus outer membrane usher protein [Enterobacter asburiae]MCK7247711.1 fimbria/pilus outer membrane usher protein [Enterobacter asburiae]
MRAPRCPGLSRLALAVGLACAAGHGEARDYHFDPSLLDGDGQHADIALFEQGGQLPGTYTVDILLNGERVETREVTFRQSTGRDGRPSLTPCLTPEQLSGYGVRVEDFPALLSGNGSGDEKNAGCADLSALPQAGVTFNFGAQTLALLVPPAAMRPQMRGIAPTALWNDGVPALRLNWQANASRTDLGGSGASQRRDASFIQLEPGANLGPWRLRNATTWQKYGQDSGRWQTTYTYAERGLNGIRSRLTLGDRTTPGDIFDSVPFRGAMLNSDESMVPSGLSTYAPVVHGTARTQARVEVRQNGYMLYSSLVAPGPFALTDLSPNVSGGDLEVTVLEADGSRQVFTVPYQTPAIALHEGYLKYSLMAGQYRPADGGVDKAAVYQATAMYGLPWNLTVYSGVQTAAHYQALSLGGGLALGDWGAVSLDGTRTRGQRRDEVTETGQTWRARYSKEVRSTETTFTLASYQYASSGYNTLSQVLDAWRHGDGHYTGIDRQKARTTLTVSQSLGDWGFLSLTGARENYWNRSGNANTYNAAYTVNLAEVSATLSWSENRSSDTRGHQYNDRVASLWVSVPLDRWLGGGTNGTYRWTSPSSRGETHEVGLNGRAYDRQLYWDVRQLRRQGETGGDRNNGSLDLSWDGSYGRIGGSYSRGSTVTQTGVNAAGGLVVHPQGVTFGQPLGDTIALVEAPGAAGVSVGGWPGVRTDWRGYTTLGYQVAYQENLVTLNPAELPPEAEITQTDMKVVPTQGAVIPARFATRLGGRALITLTRADGTPVPYGALATLTGPAAGTGVVGEGGQVYMTGLSPQGQLTVKWSDGQCRVNFTLPATPGSAGLYEMRNACR